MARGFACLVTAGREQGAGLPRHGCEVDRFDSGAWRARIISQDQRREVFGMRVVTLVTAQCGCGSYPVASEVDGRPYGAVGACKRCNVAPVVLPVYGSSTFVVR